MMFLFFISMAYMLCFACLTYAFLQALRAGAESYASAYSEQTARQFADIFFFIPPKRIFDLAWTSAMAIFLILFLLIGNFRSVTGAMRGLVLGGAAALLVLGMPRWILIYLRNRRLFLFNEQLVDALMTMSNALRAGNSILQAFEHIARENLNPISQEFSLFLHETRVGVKLEEALLNLEKRVPSEDLSLMIRAIEIARQTGGNLTEVFEKISATIRERIRIQARIRTLTAQGRMQGIVVGSMPIFLGLIIFGMDPEMMISFATSGTGILILILVVILEVIGALLIKKIVTVDV